MGAANWIDDNFSVQTFAIGLVGMAAIVGALASYAFLQGEKIVAAKMATMPHQTVEIEWKTAPVEKIAEVVQPPTRPIPENHIAIDVPTPTDTVAIAETPVAEEAAVTTSALPVQTQPGMPVEGLYETTKQGRLPILRKADGMTPFQAYRRPFTRDSRPVISLAVFDLGLSDSATKTALADLPPEVSVVFSPYMNTPELWVTEAQTRGHEIWLSLPVEVANYPFVDPGPQTALIGAAEKENLTKLYWTLGRATNYAGFVTPPDPAFIKAEQDMRPLLTRIYGRGLGFIDGSLMPALIPQTMAQSMSAPYGTVDIWADAAAEKASIADALAQAEKLAAEQGFAAVVIRPYPLSYKMVKDWIATLPGKGMVLAPLSAQTGM